MSKTAGATHAGISAGGKVGRGRRKHKRGRR